MNEQKCPSIKMGPIVMDCGAGRQKYFIAVLQQASGLEAYASGAKRDGGCHVA